MKKMLLIDLKCHMKTKSTIFLYEIFEKVYEVTYISYAHYENIYEGIEAAEGNRYDVLVLLQTMPEISFLVENFVFDQGVFIPMYDSVVNLEYDWMKRYTMFKVICFSKTLYKQLISKGYRAYYIQYFPKPIKHDTYGNSKSVFFWYRSETININTVVELLKNVDIGHIHIHKAPDSIREFIELSDDINMNVSYSRWFENVFEMYAVMQKSAFYIAPRLYEGIGMGFLNAMALGRCVIAPNTPTMNEYIQDGVNGILYDPNQIISINVGSVKEIQKRAERYIADGYKRWKENKVDILEWIEEDIAQPFVTVVTIAKDVFRHREKDIFCQCIESVHNQLYPNIQHLIIDMNSKDGTVGILKQYKKLGWIEYILETETGMYSALNKGIQNARGKYIVFLNSSSYFHDPNAIEKSVFFIENTHSDFSFASNLLIGFDEDNIWSYKPSMGRFVVQMPFNFQTMFASKNMLEEVGMFNDKYNYLGDYDLVLKVILKGYKYIEIDENIVTCRQNIVSNDLQKKINAEKKEIFKDAYYKYYDNKNSEENIEYLINKICPITLLSKLKENVPLELVRAIDNEVAEIDEGRQLYYFKEVSMKLLEKNIINIAISSEERRKVEVTMERLNKFTKYFQMMNRWLWIKTHNKNISSYFLKRNYREVAIYGFGEIGKRLYEDLDGILGIKVLYAIDKRVKNLYGLKVYGLEDKLPKVDVIVVTVNYIFEEVKRMLKEKTDVSVISINEVIFSIE